MTISPERLRKLHYDFRLDSWDDLCDERLFVLAVIEELEQARTTLEGVAKGTHVIVPRAVTADMTEAGYRAYYETPAGISCDPFLLHRFAAVWSAMLATEKEPAQENRATNLCDGSVCSCGWCPALMEAEKSVEQGEKP